ncbi:MAG TPA: tetratricopeptide repeat protein [Usitatibacteraceae bacterium]
MSAQKNCWPWSGLRRVPLGAGSVWVKTVLFFFCLVTMAGLAQAECCRNWQEFKAMCNAQGMDARPWTDASHPLACVSRIDPRIAQANQLNELGRAALQAKRYDEAARYFEQADSVYPNDVYRSNRTLALSGKYFAAGLDAMNRRDWRQAIAQFQQAQALQSSDAAANNIRACQANIAREAANAAWQRRDWDVAIAAFENEKRWWPDASIDDSIRGANAHKYFDRGRAAFAAENYALAFNEYAASLNYDPGSTAAIKNAGLCEERQGRQSAQGGDMDGATAHFSREFDFLEGRAGAAKNPQEVREYLSRARRVARSELSRVARSDRDWDLLVNVHEQWFQRSNNDATAQDQLTTVSAMRINKSIGSVQSVESAQAAAGQYEALLQQDPSNQQAAWGLEQATKVLKQATITRIYIETETKENQRAIKLLDKARGAIKDPKACFDGTGGPCDESSGNEVVVPTPTGKVVYAPGMYLPPETETPELKALREDILKKQAANEKELAQYKIEGDALKRRQSKSMLEYHAEELKTAQEDYAKKATELVSHSIKPKSPSAAQAQK